MAGYSETTTSAPFAQSWSQAAWCCCLEVHYRRDNEYREPPALPHMNMKCGLCQKELVCQKLLSCLHTLCFTCLPRQLTDKSAVKCPVCLEATPSQAGLTQMQALPDVELGAAVRGGQRTGVLPSQVIHCDECIKPEDAVAVCLDCSDNFCKTHETGHLLSRKTHTHRLKKLESGAEGSAGIRKAGSENCQIHVENPLDSYCTSCHELLCEACQQTHSPTHKDTTLSLAEAVDRSKTAISTQLGQSSTGNDQNVLETALGSVSGAISQLHTQMENTSESITQYFVGLVEQARLRQAELLQQLDRLHILKLLSLEQQKQQLHTVMTESATVTDLLLSSQTDANYLRMSRWLEIATEKQVEAIKSKTEPCASANFVFTPWKGEDAKRILAEVGHVNDATPNAANSTVTASTPTCVDQDMTITVLAKDEKGDIIQAKDAVKAMSAVEVVAPNSDIAHLQLAPAAASSSSDEPLVTTYRPSQPGEHHVTFKVGKDHVQRSPLTINVIRGEVFDRTKCHADLTLSNNDMTVETRTKGGSWFSVLGTAEYGTGAHEITLKIEEPQGNLYVFIGMTRAEDARLAGSYHGGERSLWCTQDGIQYKSAGGYAKIDVGQPWRSGDVIQLRLNCDQHTLTLHHQRTGKSDTKTTTASGKLRLWIGLRHKSSVTLL